MDNLALVKLRQRQNEVLHDWFRSKLKVHISRKAVCEHHQAPWEFFADAFYERHPQIIGLSSRTGGKSLGVAGLNVAEMAIKPRCGIVCLAGNLNQAKRGYQYVKDFVKTDKGLASKLDGPPLLTKTRFTNGSNLEILTASERSVHSPHVPKLRIDEVDLVTEELYQGALSIPISLPGIRATVVMTSTRFKAYGMMYNLVENAPDRGAEVKTWCVREAAEPCPFKYAQCPMRVMDNDETPFCDGKCCKRTEGFLKIEDLADKYKQMDAETWNTQWLVHKPSRFGLVYDMFSDAHIVKDDDLPPHLRLEARKDPHGNIRLDPSIMPDWQTHFSWGAGMDWGYEDPYVCLLIARMANDDIYVLDELYLRHHPPSKAVERAVRRFPMLQVPLWKEQVTQDELALCYGDPSDPAWTGEFLMSNVLVRTRRYLIPQGVSIIRRFFRPPGEDRPKLYVHMRCTQLRDELNRYHLKEASDVPAPGYDHGPDALRYYMDGTFLPDPIATDHVVFWSPPGTRINSELDMPIPGSLDSGFDFGL